MVKRIKFLAYCHVNAAVGHNSPFHPFQMNNWGGASQQVSYRQSGTWSGGTESIWSDEALLLTIATIKGKITCSWYTNHFQLVELCCSITDVIDSILVSTYQYANYGYVWNGYYPLMKYSIRILREIRGWLLSRQRQFDFWPSTISVIVPWLSSWPRTKVGI